MDARNLPPDQDGTQHWLRRGGAVLLGRLQPGSFARGVSMLFLATLFAQGVSFLASPVLTRFYNPAEYGILAVFAGLLTVLTAVACLRYDAALPIARSGQEASDLLGLGAMALIITTLAVLAASLLFPTPWLKQLGLGLLVPYRLFVPLGFCAAGLFGLLSAYATLNGAYGLIARTRVSQALAGPASQVAFALLGLRTVGLILGQIIGLSAGVLSLLRDAFARHPPRPTLAGMRIAASRYRAFPLISSWGILIDMVGATLALYLLANLFYAPAVAGFLFLTDRMVGRPLGLLANSLGPVMLGAAGRDLHVDPNRLQRRFMKVGALGFGLALGWIVAVNIAATWVFPRLFGAKWAGAVPYVHATSIWFLFAGVARLLGPTLQVLERQTLNIVPQVGGPLLAACAFALCARAGFTAPTAVLAYAICQAAAFGFVIVATIICLRRLPTRAAEPA